MANPNIVGVTSIYGNTSAVPVTSTTSGSPNIVVSNPASSGAIYKINSLMVTSACSAPILVYVTLTTPLYGTTNLAYGISIPASSMLAIMGKDTQIYLQENSTLNVYAGTGSYLTATCSWEQITA